MSDSEPDWVAYRKYLELWQSENPIKTNKLQIFLLTNALLAAALALGGGLEPANWLIALCGALVSGVWVLSIGRTALFQKVWQTKLKQIAAKPEWADDPRFQILHTEAAEAKSPDWLRALGGVSSKYYLMGAPLLGTLLWLAALIMMVANR